MPSEEPPGFDVAEQFGTVVSEAPADERVYGVALQLHEPARVADIAERAECAPDTARRHLRRLAELGVVELVTDSPAAYRRNEAYFEWRERQRLADCSMTELRDRLKTLVEREQEFKDRYDADTPANVSVLEHADDDIEAVWLDLSEWGTVRDRIERLDAVRRDRAADSAAEEVA